MPLHNSRTQILTALHLCGQNYENLERVAAQCCEIDPVEEPITVTILYGAVGVERDVRRMCDEFCSAHGDGIEILVTNAGLNRVLVGVVEDINSADFDLVMNLKGMYA